MAKISEICMVASDTEMLNWAQTIGYFEVQIGVTFNEEELEKILDTFLKINL